MKRKILFLLFTFLLYTSSIPQVFAAEQNYYTATSVKDIENIIFSAIENRVCAFHIKYIGNTDNIISDIKIARDAAVVRDPYEEGCISMISGYNVSKFSDHADISFDGFAYYTTADQEKYVDNEIKSLVSQLITPEMNEAQKEKNIHDYIVSHIEYDITLQGYTAYSALHDGKTVCNGYAQTAYRMLKEAGIESLFVKGTYNSNGDVKDHEWNLVKINSSWYHLDVTLDDSTSDTNNISYLYYNLSDSQIQKNHSFDLSLYPAASSEFPADIPKTTNPTNPPTLPTIPTTVNNNSDYTIINKYSDIEQPINKVWRIKFNNEINNTSVNTNIIAVFDSNDNPVSGVNVTSDITGNEIIISPPSDGYKSGESYYIIISDNIKSSSGNSLKKSVKMPFKIK